MIDGDAVYDTANGPTLYIASLGCEPLCHPVAVAIRIPFVVISWWKAKFDLDQYNTRAPLSFYLKEAIILLL